MTAKNKVLIGLVIAALVSRIAPHYPNFTAMGALAFMGANRNKSLFKIIALTFGVLMVTDVFINNFMYPSGTFVLMYKGSIWTYAGFIIYAVAGHYSKSGAKGIVALIVGSIGFFLLSNLGVFLSEFSLFPRTFSGLAATYAAGLPFYAPELISTALFSAIAYAAEIKLVATAKA
ncbi:MAG: hypothetical protein P8I47_00830 [Schleiferiaceae bacterium]|nr:hypothetical protein [Schleiferiaceae bacterium]MDG1312756.1 hypothetical protein [Schleiferiaceae bacterium]MDG1917930.1 hypothetical protein [Schleiferiaceae bacterium]